MDKPDVVKVLEARTEARTVTTLVLDRKVEFSFGQFFMIWLPGVGEKPYACSKAGGNMELTVRNVGAFSDHLSQLRPGDQIGVRGPYGKGTFKIKGDRICFVAGGLGIVPLIPAIESLKGSGKSVSVILGAKTKDELLFTDRIKDAGAELFIATDDGSAGEKCFCHQALERILDEGKTDQVLCCGPEVMMREVLRIVLAKGVPAQFSLERHMKCGIGVCGSCCMDPWGLAVCRDGPVFDSEKLKDTEFGRYKRDASGAKTRI